MPKTKKVVEIISPSDNSTISSSIKFSDKNKNIWDTKKAIITKINTNTSAFQKESFVISQLFCIASFTFSPSAKAGITNESLTANKTVKINITIGKIM